MAQKRTHYYYYQKSSSLLLLSLWLLLGKYVKVAIKSVARIYTAAIMSTPLASSAAWGWRPLLAQNELVICFCQHSHTFTAVAIVAFVWTFFPPEVFIAGYCYWLLYKFVVCTSLRAHLRVVGILRFMSDINQPSLPTAFYSVFVSISVFVALSTVFHSIHFSDNSPFSDSVIQVFSLPYSSFQLYISLYESLL